MRRWIFIAGLLCIAWTPIYEVHDTARKVDDEFKNVEQNLQDQQFTVWKTTPNLTDLKDGQVVIFSSGAVKIMFRQLNDLYAIQVSCITIQR